jgi:hypothetical protein
MTSRQRIRAEAFEAAAGYMRTAWMHNDGEMSMKEFFMAKARKERG